MSISSPRLVFLMVTSLAFLWYFFLSLSIILPLSSISWGLMPNLLCSTSIFFLSSWGTFCLARANCLEERLLWHYWSRFSQIPLASCIFRIIAKWNNLSTSILIWANIDNYWTSQISQSSNWHSKAVPLSVQKSGWWDLVLRSTGRMKLVLWPVVERTPALLEVL